MQFLRTLFWVVVAVAAVIFATRNWVTVQVNLWGGIVADTKLPVLIFGAFLLGLLPPYIIHRATRWSLRRRLEAAERALAETRGTVVAPLPTSDEPALASGLPLAVPPAAP
jgi:lipopolysaccharide assembly protein A